MHPSPPGHNAAPCWQWDIFCHVIDNYGDIGVCWRLCADLAQRNQHVRLWASDASALAWMAPAGHVNIQVLPFNAPPPARIGDVVIESFGCELPAAFLACMSQQARLDAAMAPLWLNLEYLSAEDYVERCHGLASPVAFGPGAGLQKYFFYPGFTPVTGGLLREPGLQLRQKNFSAQAWRHTHQAPPEKTFCICLFCYETDALPELLTQLAQPSLHQALGYPHLLLTHGRAQSATQAAASKVGTHKKPVLHALPALTQQQFDELLWACDLNFVRGEDSLVRALWAGKPFIWHIYPQHDFAHHAKLLAFLDWLQAPDSLRQFHLRWNGLEQGALPVLTPHLLACWQQCVLKAQTRLIAQTDLVTRLLGFCHEKK